MKAKSILILAMLVAIGPVTQSAESKTGERSATSNPISKANTAQDDTVIADTLTTPAVTPRSPKELMQDYEAEMAAITRRFSATLAGITEAVQRGELTSEQGQKISAEQYEMAEMQFELLGAWRAMLEQDQARVPSPAAEATPTSASDNGIVTVALPFSSFQLNTSVVEYLRLSKSQAEAIQQVMMRERRNLEGLMAQLRTTTGRLRAAAPEHTSEKDIKALADKQAGLLAKLIVANARMHSNIYKLLTPEQQEKLNDFTRSRESTTGR